MVSTLVPRIDGATPESFAREFVNTRTPVVLCNTRTAERFGMSWDAPSILASTGELQFNFKSSSTNAHPNFRAATLGEMFARQTMTFAEFFELILRGPEELRSHYIFTGDEHYIARQRNGEWNVNPDLEALWDAIFVPPFVPRAQVYSVWSWFSGKGVRTWLHYDNNGCHNLNVQLQGEKRCVLFPPSVVQELDFFEPGQPVPAYNCSRWDIDDPKLEERVNRLPNHVATLQAGDLLFIPAHWIHTFRHDGAYNANVNFWWKPLDHEHPLVDDNDVARREAQLGSHRGY